jgi:hypothetical protein
MNELNAFEISRGQLMGKNRCGLMSVGIVGVLSSSVQLQSIDLLLLSFVLLFLFLSHRSV